MRAGPGSLSNEQAQQSLLIFGIWEEVFGAAARARIRRVVNLQLGYSLQAFGADLDKVDAIATRATFGSMCPAQACQGLTELSDLRAPFVYAKYSVDQMLDVLRSTVLAAEVGWNQVVNIALAGAPGRLVLGYTAGPDSTVEVAPYGWRLTWTGAYGEYGCQGCLWAQMGVRYGPTKLRAQTGPDGWVQQISWDCRTQGVTYLPAADPKNASAGQYLVGTPAECKAACAASPSCAGFSFDPGAPVGDAFDISTGSCYFVADVSAMGSATWLWLTYNGPSPNVAALGNGSIPSSCFSRAVPQPAVRPDVAWSNCASHCGDFYAVPSPGSADLDLLEDMVANVTHGALLEQQLSDVLFAANGHQRMEGIMVDALERWWRVARDAGGTVCMPPLDRWPGQWSFAGGFTKGVDSADFALRRSPIQQNPPKFLAVRGWMAGAPLILPFTAGNATTAAAAAACLHGCVWGSCVNGSCACFWGFEGVDCQRASVSQRPPNECQGGDSPLGVNVAGFCYWCTQWDYVDVFKKSGLADTSSNQGWITQSFVDSPWDMGLLLNLSGGYPALLPPNLKIGRLMVRDLAEHGISGVYTVLWEGDGTVTCNLYDVKQVWRPYPGRIDVLVELSMDANNGLFLSIERTNPLDPVRNIRVLTPGFGGGGGFGGFRGTPFHPAFIESLQRFRVLRFMDWQATNGIGAGSWAQRPKRSDVSYVTNGAPLEDILLLANTVGADAWLCIPHLADDDYVLNFAKMVRDGLRPDRKAYIEYSNELWQTGFPGGQYADEQGIASGLGRLCWAVQRLRNISRIFQGVFGEAERMRFTTVVSSQISNPDATRQILACSIGAAGEDIDAIAVAPYFDGFNPSQLNVSAVLAGYAVGLDISLQQVAEHKALTAPRGFALLTYEGGIGSPVGSLTTLGIAAHRDPRVRGLIRRYFEGLSLANSSVGLRMQYTSTAASSVYGAFGLLEATDQDPTTAPKLQGIFDAMNADAICPLPNATSSADATSCGGRGYYAGGDGGGTGCLCFYGYSGQLCETAEYTEHYDCGYFCTFDQARPASAAQLVTRNLAKHLIRPNADFSHKFIPFFRPFDKFDSHTIEIFLTVTLFPPPPTPSHSRPAHRLVDLIPVYNRAFATPYPSPASSVTGPAAVAMATGVKPALDSPARRRACMEGRALIRTCAAAFQDFVGRSARSTAVATATVLVLPTASPVCAMSAGAQGRMGASGIATARVAQNASDQELVRAQNACTALA